MAELFTIAAASEAELRAKDSRFLAWLAPVDARAHAEELIAKRSQRYADATHNCFALRVGSGDQLLARSSDAQEPAGTAGRPILQALESHRLTNIVAVVTRYFGGTKLGIGGLIRAYAAATHAAIAKTVLIPVFASQAYRLIYQYHDSSGIEKALHKFALKLSEADFGSEIKRVVEIRAEHAEEFESSLQEASAGRVAIERV
jgi:uncharacterized YigZ family protein